MPEVGAFSPYLKATTFWGFEIYTQKCMILRDFDKFLFLIFLEFFGFCVLHYTREIFQKSDAKRNDHVFT